MSEIVKGGNDYIGYDYKTVVTDGDKMSMYLDAYKNFGWWPDDSVNQFGNTANLKLKRDRKILNKAELTRLQQHFEACIDEILTHEKSKTKSATMLSVLIGVIGTAFMAGSVFAVTNEPPLILLCVLLGIPGFIGWGVPYFIFKFMVKRRTNEIIPLIEQKYDEVHAICEKASILIH